MLLVFWLAAASLFLLVNQYPKKAYSKNGANDYINSIETLYSINP